VITGHLGVAGLLRSTSGADFGARAYLALAFASLAPDVADGLFYLAGICSPYGLYTHTLYAVLLQAALVGAAAFLLTDSRGSGVLYTSAVLLHLPADYFTGQKLLFPGGEFVGLYLYDVPPADFALETVIVLIGWYAIRRKARDPVWLRSGWLLGCVLATQAVFDITAHSRMTTKPTACFRTPTIQR